MDLSIIIPTHNRARDLEHLLQTIVTQDFNEPFEVIVVANLEGDASAEVLERFSGKIENLHFEVSGVLGVNIARNIGLERSRGRVLLFLDDDVRLTDKNYLQNIMAAHAAAPNAVGIGGRYQLMEPATDIELAYHLTCDLWLLQSRLLGADTLNLVGGNASYKDQIKESGHRFEEDIKFGGAETQFNARLLNAGLKLHLQNDLAVEHDVRLGLRGFLYRAFRQGAARRRIILEGFDANCRFFHQSFDRKQQVAAFLPEQKLRWNTIALLRLFDFAFEFGFEWAGIALYEDRRWRIVQQLLGARLWKSYLRMRRSTMLWSVVQSVRISWPQRARFNFPGRNGI